MASTHRVSLVRSLLVGVTLAVAVLSDGHMAFAAPPSDTSGTANGVELTARWWQVAITNFGTFFTDSTTGDNCVTVALPSGPVVLVAGSLGGTAGPRACTVPAAATLVIPVVNQLYAVTAGAPDDRVGLGRLANTAFLTGITSMSASVNGVAAPIWRISSSRFSIDGALFGLPGPLVTVSDGYWLVLHLSPGVYQVLTDAVGTGFTSATSYTLTVN